MTNVIEVTFTRSQMMAMQFDAIDELVFVRGTKTTITYAATRDIWEREARFCGCFGIAGSEWTVSGGHSYARSASSAEGRIVKALNKATK